MLCGYCSCEFQQFDHINDLATTPDDYFQIVEGKTAGPFAAGCKAAALIAGCDDKQAEKMFEFGLQLGIAFQLVDDLLIYTEMTDLVNLGS